MLFLIPFAATLLVLMARFDIYLSNRRKRLANARYLAEMDTRPVRGAMFIATRVSPIQ